MGVEADATAYYSDLDVLYRQALLAVNRLWLRVDQSDIFASWGALLPEAAAIVVAAQSVAAEFANPYLTQVLDDADLDYPAVNVEGVAGQTSEGDPIPLLLGRAAEQALRLARTGVARNVALKQSGHLLAQYAHDAVADSGRLAVSSGMGARSHAAGYYRMLRPPSCARCAILAGKWFRWNRGFRRHRRCDCVHIPVREAAEDLRLDVRKSIAAGQVTGLSKRKVEAILELGADPAQVVNAQRDMYTAMGGRGFTTVGTTRRAVAGARILARSIDRTLGLPTDGLYTNNTFDRQKAAYYMELFRRGKTYTRLTKSGRPQSYAYRFVMTPRLTPEQIMKSADDRAEAIKLLTNNGYIY